MHKLEKNGSNPSKKDDNKSIDKKTIIGLVAGLAIVAGLVGITVASGGEEGNGKTPTSNPSSSQSSQPGQQNNVTNTGGAQAGEMGAVADMSNFSCKQDNKKAWNATWNIKNPDKEPATYRIIVNITNDKNQVLDKKEVSQQVPAGKTQQLKADEIFTNSKDQKNINCFAGVYKKK